MDDKRTLKREALFRDSLAAFACALLLGRAWQMPEHDIDLFFIFFTQSIPDYTGLGAILGLMALSVFLVVASSISKVANWVFHSRGLYKPTIEILGVTGFLIGWASAIADLPEDQWWTLGLEIGGAALVIILFFKCVQGLYSAVRQCLRTLSQPVSD